MQFCPECDNMLYFNEIEGKLWKMCKVCDFKQESTESVVSRTVYKEAHSDPSVRQWMRYSPAVARTIHKSCPNDSCPSRADTSLQEAIIIKKEQSLEVLYICAVCNTEWNYTGKMTLVIFKRKVNISINWGLISQISNGIWIIFMTIAWCFAWCLCFAITASSTIFHYNGVFKPVTEIRTAENGANIYDVARIILFCTTCFTFLMLLLIFADMKVDITLYIGLAVSLAHHAGFIAAHLLGMLCMATTKSSTATLFVGIGAALGLSVCVWAFRYVKNTPELHLVKIECSEV